MEEGIKPTQLTLTLFVDCLDPQIDTPVLSISFQSLLEWSTKKFGWVNLQREYKQQVKAQA